MMVPSASPLRPIRLVSFWLLAAVVAEVVVQVEGQDDLCAANAWAPPDASIRSGLNESITDTEAFYAEMAWPLAALG